MITRFFRRWSRHSDDAEDFGLQLMASVESPIWNLGYRTGIARSSEGGRTPDFIKLAVLEQLEERRSKVTESKVAATSRLRSYSSQYQPLEEEVANQEQLLLKLQAEKVESPSRYSLLTATVYIVSALLLFLSDFPLSLMLTESFNMQTRTSGVEMNQLLSQPLEVLAALWEPLLLGLGIMVLGVFMKFFFEENIFNWRGAVRERLPLFVANCSLVLLLVAVVVSLGLLRAETHLVQQASVGSGVAPPVALLRLAFVSVSVMVPLAGGLLFAAGLERVHKFMNFFGTSFRWRRSIRNRSKVRSRMLKAEVDVEAAEGRLEYFSQYQETLRLALESLYHHGWEAGKSEALSQFQGLSLTEQCEDLVSRKLHFQTLGDSKGPREATWTERDD